MSPFRRLHGSLSLVSDDLGTCLACERPLQAYELHTRLRGDVFHDECARYARRQNALRGELEAT